MNKELTLCQPNRRALALTIKLQATRLTRYLMKRRNSRKGILTSALNTLPLEKMVKRTLRTNLIKRYLMKFKVYQKLLKR